jgi:crotonobetainyl-CoA:carnitine CoA-transferase CaiB-like acyl-CoA transferase
MGPLTGIRILEFAGIGPAPMAAMMLAEMGATVLRIDRVADSDLGIPMATKFEVLKRSRHIIRLDLKRPEAVAMALRLVEQSDALIEGFRPKVMERLGLGPDVAIIAARQSGRGQVVDAAMVDGASSLMTSIYGGKASGRLSGPRGTNITDSGAYFYDVYECADGRYVSVAAIEAKFHAELLRLLEIDPATVPPQMDRSHWPKTKQRLAERFKTRTRDEWCALLEGTDACFAPVLSMDEAPHHPHNRARNVFVDLDGVTQPMPAPRFSGTPLSPPTPPEQPDMTDLRSVLAEWSIGATEVETAQAHGFLA